MDTNRAVLASTGVTIRAAGDTVVVGTMNVAWVERCGFGEDGKSGEENEGGEELHECWWRKECRENVVVRRKEESAFLKRGAKCE